MKYLEVTAAAAVLLGAKGGGGGRVSHSSGLWCWNAENFI